MLQAGHVTVTVAMAVGTGEANSVDQRGVIQAIGEYGVTTTDHDGHGCKVGHIAGREKRSGVQAEKVGELMFEIVVGAEMSTQIVGCTGADAPTTDRIDGCLDQALIVGEAKIVVAGEGEDGAAIDHHSGSAGRVDQPALAVQALLGDGGQLVFDHGSSAFASASSVA